MIWIELLDDSEVASLEQVLLPVELLLELVEILLFERVDGAQDVPIDGGGTGRSGDRATVYPAVLHIHHVQELTIGNFWYFRIGFGL